EAPARSSVRGSGVTGQARAFWLRTASRASGVGRSITATERVRSLKDRSASREAVPQMPLFSIPTAPHPTRNNSLWSLRPTSKRSGGTAGAAYGGTAVGSATATFVAVLAG